MKDKPCVTVLDHDNEFISLEVNGLDYRLSVNADESTYKNVASDTVRYLNGLTVFLFFGFTICHQKGGDCYVE